MDAPRQTPRGVLLRGLLIGRRRYRSHFRLIIHPLD